MWYFLIELLDNSLPAIRVHAIHLLGMSLSAFDGVQIDNKVVIQFETMQGFQCVAENLSKHPLDNESVLDALLNLMFWRRSGNRQGHSQNPPKLSSIDEVINYTVLIYPIIYYLLFVFHRENLLILSILKIMRKGVKIWITITTTTMILY